MDSSTDWWPVFHRRFQRAGARTIEDRIFIDNQIREAKIHERWEELEAERDYNRLYTRWHDLHDALVKMAQEALGIKE